MTGINYSILWKHRARANATRFRGEMLSETPAAERISMRVLECERRAGVVSHFAPAGERRTRLCHADKQTENASEAMIGERQSLPFAWNSPAVSRFAKFSRATR